MPGIKRTPDVGALSAAVSRPGIDPRIWITTAYVTDVAPYVGEDGATAGVLVDLTYTDTAEQETAFLGVPYAGEGFGMHCPLRVDDTVLVAVPKGDPQAGPIIVARYWNAGDKPPPEIVVSGEVTRDFVLVVEDGQNLKLKTSGAGTIQMQDASQSFVRGDAQRDALNAFIDALGVWATAVETALTTLAGAPTPPPPVPLNFVNAQTTLKNQLTAALSSRIKGE